jgi:hypothetical protein
MLVRRHSREYHFVGDGASGATFRWGRTTAENPALAPWPELADISVSNRCSKGCGFCYRDSKPDGRLMSVPDYAKVLDELTHPQWGSVFQVALGGGEPTEHPGFKEMLEETRRRGIFPNFTTNGDSASPETARKLGRLAGAVAVSVAGFGSGNLRGARLFSDAGVRTNLHCVLSPESLGAATAFLEGRYDSELIGINAVVFLALKRTGRASNSAGLERGPGLGAFFDRVSSPGTKVRFGFDACLVPQVLSRTWVNPAWLDACECAFFSVYVDEALTVKPCSFSRDPASSFDLKKTGFRWIWEQGFSGFRERAGNVCVGRSCPHKKECRGSCPLYPELMLCEPEISAAGGRRP